MDDAVFAWGLVGALVLAVLAVTSVHLVPADERLVRFRRGRGPRVAGPGFALVVPGVDRGVRVPVRPTWTDVVWLQVTTRDGVPVTVHGAALVSTVDPIRYALAAEPIGAATDEAVEAELERYVAERDLVELTGWSADRYEELAAAVDARTREWGVGVTRVELSSVDARLGPELVRWAEDLLDHDARGRSRVLLGR